MTTTPLKIGSQVWIYGHGQPRQGYVVEVKPRTALVHYDTPNGRRHTKRLPLSKCYSTREQLMIGEYGQPPVEYSRQPHTDRNPVESQKTDK